MIEFIEGQEILDEIAEGKGLSESFLQDIVRQILEGLEYLHTNHVAHRDIKPSNILITKNRKRVCLVDFNTAKQVKEGDMLVMYTKSAGTLSFSAPERLTENCVYTEKVDMWACGIVLYMLLVGEHPFDGNGTTAQLID